MRNLDTRRIGASVAVGAAVVLIAALLIVLAGADPFAGLRGLVEGISSSPYRIGEVLIGATPVAIIALTLIPALRAGVFSVGAEGQVIIGAMFATAAILGLRDLLGESFGWLYTLIGILAGALGGALTALLPAWLAVKWRVNEILSTLLLNYIAAGVLGFSLRTWLASPDATATPQSERLPEAAGLPDLIPGTRAHVGILLVVVAIVVFEWWRRSSGSTRLAVFAERPQLARRLGTDRARAITSTMLVSGVGAGIVGWMQVAGVNERLMNSVSGGVGFSGIAVALLGALLPGGILVAALLFSALTAGAVGMQAATGSVPASIAEVIKGVILLGVACIAGMPRTAARVRRGTSPAAPAQTTDASSEQGVPDPAPAPEPEVTR